MQKGSKQFSNRDQRSLFEQKKKYNKNYSCTTTNIKPQIKKKLIIKIYKKQSKRISNKN